MKNRRANGTSKKALIVGEKRLGQRSRLRTSWPIFTPKRNHGSASRSAAGGAAISFLARYATRRRSRANGRFLGVPADETAHPRLRSASDRWHERASRGNRRADSPLLREL